MRKFTPKILSRAGSAPSVLFYTGDHGVSPTNITLIKYDANHCHEKTYPNLPDALAAKGNSQITWLNVDGVHETSIIEAIGHHFNLHILTQEDIVNTTQRPKLEIFDDYIYFVFKMLYFDDNNGELHSEQISLVLGNRYLLSFQEVQGDIFNAVRERLHSGKGRIRKWGQDYLAYALLDAMVDHIFDILEKFGSAIEELDEALLENPTHETMHDIHAMRQELLFLQKEVSPMREVINTAAKHDIPLIEEKTALFMRDVYDHVVQVSDTITSYRDILNGMLDLHLSVMSHRSNEVMKVLTMMATIFIPITFIVGVYGMNFNHMPELAWRWGYIAVWVIILFIVVALVVYFKRKKWF